MAMTDYACIAKISEAYQQYDSNNTREQVRISVYNANAFYSRICYSRIVGLLQPRDLGCEERLQFLIAEGTYGFIHSAEDSEEAIARTVF